MDNTDWVPPVTYCSQKIIEAAAAAIDTRADMEKLRIVQEWMTHEEAVAILCVAVIKQQTVEDLELRALAMSSLIDKYASDGIRGAFFSFYGQMIDKGVSWPKVVPSDWLEATVNIYDLATEGKQLGWEHRWGTCLFNAKFQDLWDRAFV